MARCREVARLLASGEFAGPGWWRRLPARVHLAVCRNCRGYAAGLHDLGSAAREAFVPEREDDESVRKIGESLAARIESPGSPPRVPPED